MKYHETTAEVRFYEADMYNMLWHGNYAAYLEIGRLDLCSKFGLSIADMKTLGVYSPVVEMKIRYRSPARFGDKLIIKTTVLPTERASLTFQYLIERPSDNTLIAEAETTHVMLNSEGKMLYILPDDIMGRIENLLRHFGRDER